MPITIKTRRPDTCNHVSGRFPFMVRVGLPDLGGHGSVELQNEILGLGGGGANCFPIPSNWGRISLM
jgi:hypothetical protein